MKIEKENIKKGLTTANRSIGDFDIIDSNATIKVGCNSCGKCCRNRNDILLRPNDLYGIAKSLNKPITDILKICDIYIGDNSQVPIINLRFRKQDNGDTICPYLKKAGENIYHCRVHENKPSVCRIYPLGRIHGEGSNVEYIIQDIKCVDEKDKFETTIDEWTLRKQNYGEEFLLAYFDLLESIRNSINLKKLWRILESKPEEYVAVNSAFVSLLYSLDTDKSLKENLDEYVTRKDTILQGLILFLKKQGYGVIK